MFVIYIYVALASYNTGYLTLSMDSVECLVDEAANVAVVDANGRLVYGEQGPASSKKVEERYIGRKKGAKGKSAGHSRQCSLSHADPTGLNKEIDWRNLWNEGTDAVMDIPIGGVCEILYGSHDSIEDGIAGQANGR